MSVKYSKKLIKVSSKRKPAILPKTTIFVRNSFCELIGFPEQIEEGIEDLLSYENEDTAHEIKKCYNLVAMAKRKNNKRMIYAIRSKIKKLQEKQNTCWLQDGKFPTGLLPLVKDFLSEMRFHDFTLEDCRQKPQNFQTFRWYNEPPELRYYQDEMVDAALVHERGVFEAAVGSGKTRVLMEIIKRLGVNSLIVVPSSALQEQIGRVMRLAFGKGNITLIDSRQIKRGTKLAPIRIVTIQTMASLQKNNLLTPLLKDIDLLAIDEIHHAGSESYTNLLPDLEGIYYRFGFSGTFLRNDSKTLDMWGFLSNVLYYYPPHQAVADGFLTPVQLCIETLDGVFKDDYTEEYNRNYCVKKVRSKKTKKTKLVGAEKLIPAILRRVANLPKTDQILILVDRKDDAGKIIYERLKPHNVDIVYVSGDDKKEIIADAIEKFNAEDTHIMVGSTVIGEGVDIHSSKHLINAMGGKSAIKLVQAIGRCVRLHPGKKKAYVYDFNFDGTKYLQDHCTQRVEIFRNHFDGEVVWE